jgi:CRP/FNR family transcriptional regulator
MSSWLEFIQNYKTIKLFSEGLKVFSEGDLVTGIYVVCSGKLKITMKTDKSGEKIIRLAGEGQVLGHRGFSKNMTYPISAETITSCELAYIPNEEFFKLLRNNADLSFFMMMFFADELHRSEQKFRLHSVKSDTEKVAASLCLMIDAFAYKNDGKNTIDSTLSLADLSNYAETPKESLKKILNFLSGSEIIELVKNDIVVKNESALRIFANFMD